MKYLFYFVTIGFLFPSCASTYYFSTLDSATDNTIKGDNGDFVTGNDSIMIAYCFNGEEGPILIMIQNDGNKPLYVDWQRSSIIYKERATSYYDRNIKIQGKTNSYSVNDNFVMQNGYSTGEFRGTANIPEGVTFIPPHSRVEYQTKRLGNPSYENIPDKEYIKTSFVRKDDSPARIKNMDFTIQDSPFKFRSYLTLYTDPTLPFTFEDEFYVSNIMKSKELTPSNMSQTIIDRGDLFYIEQESKGKGAGSALLVSGLVVGLVALDVATSNNNCCY